MASMKACLEKLSVSQMTILQEKLGIPVVMSKIDEIIKIICEHKDYKKFCQNERSKDAKKAYQNIMKMTNAKSADQIRTLQSDFSEKIRQKETQLPLLFIENFISNEKNSLLSLNKINTDQFSNIDNINLVSKSTGIENQHLGKACDELGVPWKNGFKAS